LKASVVILYLEYGAKHRWQIEMHLKPLVHRLFRDHRVALYIIDNSGAVEPYPESKECRIIEGDNSAREFSGWDKALTELLPHLDDSTVLCFCNDTFARNYDSNYLNWFDPEEVARAIGRHAIVGYVDEKPAAFCIENKWIQSWLRTSLFLTTVNTTRKLLPFRRNFSASDFAKSGDSLFSPNGSIHPEVAHMIDRWLVKKSDTSNNEEGIWHSAVPLNEQNRTFLQEKAKSILTEFSLSARVQAQGIEIFDVRKSKTRAKNSSCFRAK
jgi:hypothetical protein